MAFDLACRLSAVVLAATAFAGLLFARIPGLACRRDRLRACVHDPSDDRMGSGTAAERCVRCSNRLEQFANRRIPALPFGPHNALTGTASGRNSLSRHTPEHQTHNAERSQGLPPSVRDLAHGDSCVRSLNHGRLDYVSIFVLYVLAAVWSCCCTISRAAPRLLLPKPGRACQWLQLITSGFFWLTNGIAGLTFLFTLIIFLLSAPRISVGVLQKARGEGLKTTGFSERVDLA